MSKLVSIIIPFYNAQTTLKESIDSVLQQNHMFFEILLVDDGSKDKSAALAKSYVDPRIRYFYQSNAGVAAARNLGLDQALGEYICFLDADDLMTLDALSARLAVFDAKPEVTIVGGAQAQKNHDLTKLLIHQLPNYRGNPKKELVKLNPKCFINCGTWLIHRGVIADVRFPLGWSHSEDLAFFFLISNKANLDFVTNTVQIYRRHTDSAMANLDGLLAGYLKFIDLVKSERMDVASVCLLKYKASKIMFLSFCNKYNFIKAIVSVVKLLFR